MRAWIFQVWFGLEGRVRHPFGVLVLFLGC
jgi:hypothetical protein